MAGSVVEMSAAYEGGQSIPQIAEALGLPRSRVRQTLLDAGVSLRSRAEAVRLAGPRIRRPGAKGLVSAEGRARIAAARAKWGEENAAGVSLKASGYVEITRGENKGRSVHVVAMEARLGRRLLPDEVVHHVDGKRSNNSIDNLALMTRAAHTRLHRREQKIAGGKS